MNQVQIDNGALTNDQIVNLVTTHWVREYHQNLRYFEGENPTIMDRRLPVVNAPNYKLPVSYARKIIKTVVGYMYKPGLIAYSTDDDSYNERLHDVFRMNNEDTKSAAMGRQASIHGMGFELHYTADGPNPYFAKIPADQMIPVYDYAIEPNMIAAIRHFRKNDDGQEVEVYYDDRVDYFFLSDKGQPQLTAVGSEPHEYDEVPLVVFENNEEWIGDFVPVKPLIDAYDLLLSDSMNEFDRFAWAYLILKNVAMSQDQADEVKYRKIIELLDDGDAKFLQKDIPSDYIRFMSDWIRKEIHKQTHVPDFTDSTLNTEMTGAAIDRLFYDFEFVAADKEDRFRDALKKRIRLVNIILRKSTGALVDAADVKITMARNKPQMLNELAANMQGYAGFVSTRTLLENFAPFVEDVDEEIEAVEEERDILGDIEVDDGDTGPGEEPEGDTE